VLICGCTLSDRARKDGKKYWNGLAKKAFMV